MLILAAPSPGSFTFEPLFAVLAVVALVLYFRAARSDRPPVLMAASFVTGVVLIGAGFAFWSPVVGSRWGGRSPVGLVPYLIVAFVAVSFLGLGLTFIPHPFYPYYTHTPRLLGMSPTEDQNLAGVVMTAEQSLVYLAGIAALLLILANREQQRVEAAQHERPIPSSE